MNEEKVSRKNMVTGVLILIRVCVSLSRSAFRHKLMSQTDGFLDLALDKII